jgi:hypothetical protein
MCGIHMFLPVVLVVTLSAAAGVLELFVAVAAAPLLLMLIRMRRMCFSPLRATWPLAVRAMAGPSGWTSLLTCTAQSWGQSQQHWCR